MDIEAYLARIRYSGDRTPSLGTLTALHHAHLFTIQRPRRDPPGLENDEAGSKRR